jgi:hypothetical protein
MCTVSFDKEVLNITIHNQYPDLELTSPVYYSNSTTYHVLSSQQTGIGATIEANFGIDSKQKIFEGALLYKLKRKYTIKTDNHPNSTASIEDSATNIHLLVVWDVEDYDHRFRVCLIEFTNDFTWDENKLWVLHREYKYLFDVYYKPNIITWMIYGDKVMKTRRDIIYGSDYKLDIVLSEGIWEHDIREPMKIDPKRSVLPLSTLTVLMYALSLSIEPSVKLNMHH